MRIAKLIQPLCAAALIAACTSVQAQLPDLRGKTLFVTGTIHVTGSVTILFQTTNFDENLVLDDTNPAKIILNNTGPEDNSVLTGTLPLPPIETPPYETCANPNIPITGSFNRSTGVLTLTGTIPGQSVFNFGVQEVNGNPNRILVRLTDLSINATGTGTIETDGTLRIRQPGDTPLTFTGTPRLALKSPDASDPCVFGGLIQANVSNASFTLKNWIAALPSVSGTVTLAECPGAANVPMTFMFHPSDNSGDFTRTVTPNADGTFTVSNLPAKQFAIRVKSANTLAKVVQADTTNGSATGVAVGALAGGDATGDNSVDVLDLAELISAFDADPTAPNWNNGIADFNCDDSVDVLDLAILIQNFDQVGEEL